jgi:hypothetical protein
LRLSWDSTPNAVTSEALRRELLAGQPRILIDDIGATQHSILINPFSLADDEAALVGAALIQALGRTRAESPPLLAPQLSVAGDWNVTIDFANGQRHHHFCIHQAETRIFGDHVLNFTTAQIEGTAGGKHATMKSTHIVECNLVRFAFRADHVSSDYMEGVVTMGASAPHTQGPVAFAQFGEAGWHATRAS